MKIGTCESKIGELTSGQIKISHSGRLVKIPVKIIQGSTDKRTAFISAGLHGDELNGVNIVTNFLDKINPNSVNGTLIVIPVINPIGFHYSERRVRYDQKDLNRCFNKQGSSISYKMANSIFTNVVRHCDFGLDFHDSNKRYILLPHTRVFHREYTDVDELSKYFGTEIVMRRKANRGMLALESKKEYNIPILTIEMGGGLNVLPQYGREGLRGLEQVLKYKGFLEGDILLPEKQVYLSERRGYRSNIEGIFKTNKKLGDIIDGAEIVGTVFNPLTEKKIELNSKHPGILFSIKATSHIKANQSAFSLLHVETKNGKIMPTEGKMIVNRETRQIHLLTSGVFNKALQSLKQQSKEIFAAIWKE
jgi:uncharacterized protein